MPVNTGKVTGRREVAYESLDDVLMDAEMVVANPKTKMLGNWSLGQMLAHLAASLHMSIDGSDHRPPWYVRLIGPILKRMVLRKMSPGFQLPKPVADKIISAEPVSPQEGLRLLQEAIKRFRADLSRQPHNVFGKLTGAEWHQLHLRHCELHMSFATLES
ncbi:MAG: DUF1569 domain-containing protein [Pirellulaceae bacterium]